MYVVRKRCGRKIAYSKRGGNSLRHNGGASRGGVGWFLEGGHFFRKKVGYWVGQKMRNFSLINGHKYKFFCDEKGKLLKIFPF